MLLEFIKDTEWAGMAFHRGFCRGEEMTDKNEINEYLHRVIFELFNKLPEDFKEKMPDITFYFDMDSIRFVRNHFCFATNQDFSGFKEITFFIDLISRKGATKPELRKTVYHEVAHALGENEEEATKLVDSLILKDEQK